MMKCIRTPEGSEDGIEDSSRMVKQVPDLGKHTDISEVPVRADFAQRTHLERMSRLTRLSTTYTQHI